MARLERGRQVSKLARRRLIVAALFGVLAWRAFLVWQTGQTNPIDPYIIVPCLYFIGFLNGAGLTAWAIGGRR